MYADAQLAIRQIGAIFEVNQIGNYVIKRLAARQSGKVRQKSDLGN